MESGAWRGLLVYAPSSKWTCRPTAASLTSHKAKTTSMLPWPISRWPWKAVPSRARPPTSPKCLSCTAICDSSSESPLFLPTELVLLGAVNQHWHAYFFPLVDWLYQFLLYSCYKLEVFMECQFAQAANLTRFLILKMSDDSNICSHIYTSTFLCHNGYHNIKILLFHCSYHAWSLAFFQVSFLMHYFGFSNCKSALKHLQRL